MSTSDRLASLRVLVIGCGSIGQRHTQNLWHIGVKEILVHDTDGTRMTALADKYNGKPYSNLADAYAAGPNAVLVCSPTSLHLPLTREAILNGCDVFVEKPLSHTLDGTEELIGLAGERGRVLAVGYNLRFNPCVRQIKSWLDQERIGRITSARLHFGSYLPARHPWEDYRQGYGARRELGGGVILDAIHEIDYALWLFGKPRRVYCVSGQFSDLEIETEDMAEITLSYVDRKVISIHVDYLQQPHRRWCELIGNGGIIYCDLVDGNTAIYERERGEWLRCEHRRDPNEEYLREIENFLSCLIGRAKPVVDGATALQSLVVAMAAKRSAVEGQAVDPMAYFAAAGLRFEGVS